MKKILPYAAIVAVVLIWGVTYLAIKYALESCTPGFLIFTRSAIASFILFFFCIKRFKKLTKKSLVLYITTGLCVAAGYLLQTNGLNYTTSAMASFLENVYLVIVPFLAWGLTKKRPTISSFVAASLAVMGVVLISISSGAFSSTSSTLGIVLCLLAGIAFGLNIGFTGSLETEKDPLLFTFIQMTTLMVVTLIYTLIFERSWPTINTKFVVSITYIAIPATVVAWLLRNYAQNKLSPITISIILPFAAVLAMVASIVVGETQLDLYFIFGSAILLIAAFLEGVVDLIKLKINPKDTPNENVEQQ